MEHLFKDSINPKILNFLKKFWISKEDEYKDHQSAESVLSSKPEDTSSKDLIDSKKNNT